MPSIADSLKAAGYLMPAERGFSSFFDSIQQMNDQKQFNQMMGEAVKGIQNNFVRQQLSPENPLYNSPAPSRLSELLPQKAGTMGLSDQSLQPAQTGISAVTPEAEPSRYLELSPEEQRQKNEKIIAGLLAKSLGLKSIPPEMLQRGQQSLQLMAQGSETPMPQYSYFNAPETSSVFRYNKTNPSEPPQVIKEGRAKSPTKTETVVDDSGNPVITERAGKKFISEKHTYSDGTTTTTLKPLPGKTTVNVNTGAKEGEPYKGYSKDLTSSQGGLDEIKNLRNTIYNDANYRVATSGPMMGKKVIGIPQANGTIKNMTMQEAQAYKNTLVAKFRAPVLSAIRRTKASEYVQPVFKYAAQKGITKSEALKIFIKLNPQMSDEQKEALQTYFELSDQ